MDKKIILPLGVAIMFLLVGAGCNKNTEIPNLTFEDLNREPVNKIITTTLPIAEENTTSTIITTSTQQTTTSTPKTSVTPTTTPKSPAPATIVNCGSKLDCLADRAKTCQKTKFLFSKATPSTEAPGVATVLNINYEITGKTNLQCSFYHTAGQFKITVTEAALQNLMKEENKSRTEMLAEIEKTNNTFKQAAISGPKTYCKTAEGSNITEHIKNMLAGKASLTQIDDKITYGNNINCVQK